MSGGFPPLPRKVARAVARVTLECAMSLVVLVFTDPGALPGRYYYCGRRFRAPRTDVRRSP
jgi:hypothetical protein